MAASVPTITISYLNKLSEDEFIALFGGIYEHSPQIARRIYVSRNGKFASPDDVVRAFVDHVEYNIKGDQDASLYLIKSYPELAIAEDESKLSAESQAEHKAGGISLDSLEPEQRYRFKQYNKDYKSKFSFPFVCCVRGYPDKAKGILAAFERRVNNSRTEEIDNALREIQMIATFRLKDRVVEDDSHGNYTSKL